MICSKCGGEWEIKRVGGILGIGGKKRHVCSKCGYMDERDCWVGDEEEYIGPKDVDPNLSDPVRKQQKEDAHIFYDLHKMPCCGAASYYEGPHGGLSTNIKCAECGAKFNVTPSPFRQIERI
jgi:DNA-directed RNA polymerase subunit RPC12/RpoP